MEAGKTLEGEVAFVTGASSGLGRAAAVELARAGADTALIARSEPELERLAAALRREGVHSLPLPTDLADADAARATVEKAIASSVESTCS